MSDPTRSDSLTRWLDERPGSRVVGARMCGRWVAAIETGMTVHAVGSGRSLHDAIEDAQDELDRFGTGRAGEQRIPPSAGPARPDPVSSLIDDTEPSLSAERDARSEPCPDTERTR